MVHTIKKSALSLGLAAVLAFAFVPLGCGSVQPVAQAPESIAGPIRTCAVEHTRHLGATDHAMTFDVKLTYNGYVDSITLIKSDVGDEELEACVASSIRSLTVEDLPLRSADNGDQELATPQSRMVLGHPAAAAACLASPPCVLGLVVLMGATVITVQIMVHAAATTTKPTATTTAPPIPIGVTRESCPPCKTLSGRIVLVGTTSYRPLETPAKPQHGIVGPHHNIYTANQAPKNSPVPCKCFWQPIGAVSPADLPTGAIPIEPFANF